MKTRLFIAFIILLGFIACKQNDPQKNATYMPIISQSLRDAVNAKAGSYFIYQDSATGTIDSFWSGGITKTTAYWGSDNTNNEQIFYDLYSNIESNISIVAVRNNIGVGISTNKYGSQDGTMMRLPFNIGATINDVSPSESTLIIAHYNSIIINTITYNDVYETETYYSSLGNGLHTWFSPQTGLIKYRGGHSYTYTLVREKIIK